MARLPLPELTAEQLALYRSLVAPGEALAAQGDCMPDSSTLDNVIGVVFHAPHLPEAFFGLAGRVGSGLDPLVRELAIMRVAVCERSSYEWLSHRAKALRAGLTDADLELLLAGQAPPEHRLLLAGVDDILEGRPLARELAEQLGPAASVELVLLCGLYQVFAHLVTAFELPLPGPEVRF